MITSSAEAIERLKQLLDNIDDEIETHVRGRDFFIALLTNETKPDVRLQAEQPYQRRSKSFTSYTR